jgi:hypothetical protein
MTRKLGTEERVIQYLKIVLGIVAISLFAYYLSR